MRLRVGETLDMYEGNDHRGIERPFGDHPLAAEGGEGKASLFDLRGDPPRSVERHTDNDRGDCHLVTLEDVEKE